MSIDPELQMTQSTSTFEPLVEHPFRGPWLESCGYVPRELILDRYCSCLEFELGESHPNTQLARSWWGVSWGGEAFDEHVLGVLKEAEPYIRQNFPEARWALCMNLAAQGCHTWFLDGHESALVVLTEAFELMLDHGVGCDRDAVKVAEVLADCLSHVGRVDEAIDVLYRVQPRLLGAVEERGSTIFEMFEELRCELIEELGVEASRALQWKVELLSAPKLRLPRGPVSGASDCAPMSRGPLTTE